MTAAVVALCAVLGFIVGSFLTIVISRVPRKESVFTRPSRCQKCNAAILVRDLVPVLSWLFLKGRCRTCGERVSVRYPVVEIVTAVLFALTALHFSGDSALAANLVVVAGLVAISFVDLELCLVPNRILYPTLFLAAPLFVVAAAVDSDWPGVRTAAIGGALGWGLLLLLHLVNPANMGFGDVRLAGLVGMQLGWLSVGHVLVGLFLAFLCAGVIGAGLIATGIKSRKDAVPFGPFIVTGTMLAIFFGSALIDWYKV